jgi:hypothetical protein
VKIFVGPFQPECVLKWSGHLSRFSTGRERSGNLQT